jgi:hypothetical protein
MAKTLALLFGVVFLLIGILGFVPAVAPNEMLLNIFHVNAAHNAIHLLTGVIALVAGMAGVGASKTFFKSLAWFMGWLQSSASSSAMECCWA